MEPRLKVKKIEKVFILLTVFFGLSALNASVSAGSEKIKAFVSILPQAYFVERVGGALVDVEVLVGPGKSPATYEPTPRQMARLGRAGVYFRIGTPFEKGFIDKVSRTHKGLAIVDTRKGVALRYFARSRGGQVPDPHIWLDPKRVKVQAATITETLCSLAPRSAAVFEENLAAFQADLDRLDEKISQTLSSLRGSRFYVFHPSFGYFGESYGLEQVAVEIEGKEPSPKQLSDLIDQAGKDGVKVIFVQPQFARRNAEAVATAIGGAVVPIDPLPRDYLKSLEEMAENLKTALTATEKPS
ncbi:MAG: metal ABC transporter solute-binding protein, Zn/Mn family [Desulfatiglandales bacterium]